MQFHRKLRVSKSFPIRAARVAKFLSWKLCPASGGLSQTDASFKCKSSECINAIKGQVYRMQSTRKLLRMTNR